MQDSTVTVVAQPSLADLVAAAKAAKEAVRAAKEAEKQAKAETKEESKIGLVYRHLAANPNLGLKDFVASLAKAGIVVALGTARTVHYHGRSFLAVQAEVAAETAEAKASELAQSLEAAIAAQSEQGANPYTQIIAA